MALFKTRDVMLGTLLLFLLLKGVQPCAQVSLESPIVPVGSPVTATCTVRNSCIDLEEEIQILWKLDEEYLPETEQNNSSWGIGSRVTLHSFNRTRGMLSCYAAGTGIPQLMDRVEIRTGYPPSKPSNLSCFMNLTEESLTCTWDPGPETYIETNVTLERYRSRDRDGAFLDKKAECTPLKGQNHCTIPRKHLNLYQKEDIWVTAENALGKTQSDKLCLAPMDAVKLDPPTVDTIKSSTLDAGCLNVQCKKSKEAMWMNQLYEMRYKSEEDDKWSMVSSNHTPDAGNYSVQIKDCGFLAATVYHFQVRRIRQIGVGHWSNWGPVYSFFTPERAPAGKLDVWWKLDHTRSDKKTNVKLMWKPMRKKDANGEILGYLVFLINEGGEDEIVVLCNTTKLACDVPVPSEVTKVYIKAYNVAGESPAREVVLLDIQGSPLSSIRAFPKNDHSLCVEWEAPKASVTRYVLEWYRVSEQEDDSTSWKTEVGTLTNSVLKENIEPYQLFHVSLYPIYEDAVGRPQHIEAYTKQKAPSVSPKLHLKSIGRSEAEIEWTTIPIEKQNGFITNHTIFWKNSRGCLSYAVVGASSRNFLLKNLEASSVYKVHLKSSTAGGSINGTILTIHTTILTDMEILMFLLALSMLLALIISFVLVVYFKKHLRMKKRLWPSVPDPANSSLGEWMPTKLQEGNIQFPVTPESNPIITSNITILEREMVKKSAPARKGDTGGGDLKIFPTSSFQLNDNDRRNRSISPSVTHMRENAQLPSYVNTSSTVQYAKIIVDPYRGQKVPVPLYLRSDSTQPLLCDMSPSPKAYENLWFLEGSPYFREDTDFQECEVSLMDFPLLQELKIQGTEAFSNSHNFNTLKHNRN
ncbi:granulocyte colony-stimulating factor receptor isoform X2 [Microcaecilia unicolor]|nr:granulocyte colony-stimulating factor receptor isoform X2 [Microcaecilia unicolor]